MNKYQYIIGIDEAGRGPLAGPVSVAAVAIPASLYRNVIQQFKGVKDSKQLSSNARERYFKQIKKQSKRSLLYAVSLVGNKCIDRIGIVGAIDRALARSLEKLSIPPSKAKILLDGGLHAPKLYVFQKTIIRGDEKEKVIALASIVAKVRRDRHMVKIAKKHKGYAFEIHKGYGTKAHIEVIQRKGLCVIHRRSFCHSLQKVKDIV